MRKPLGRNFTTEIAFCAAMQAAKITPKKKFEIFLSVAKQLFLRTKEYTPTTL
jgi:hypothetical protein